MQSIWQQLSQEFSSAVAQIGQAIVAVDGRAGHTSSGILWRPDFVLTAAHTIRQEAGIRILPKSGESVRGRLVGRAPGTDVALLKLERELQTPPAQIEGPAQLAVGELLLAVARTRRGNIVAGSGILGGLMGEWRSGRVHIDQFIRPDLNLLPGFSGGAVIGAGGKLIGMISGGLLRGRPVTIPCSTLIRVAEELAAKGHVASPYIGIVMQPVQIPAPLQKQSGVSADSGLLVMHVESGAPADTAGVLLGDILIDLDGRGLGDIDDLQDMLRQRGVNQDVKASVIRGGARVELTIKIGERPIR